MCEEPRPLFDWKHIKRKTKPYLPCMLLVLHIYTYLAKTLGLVQYLVQFREN